MLANYARDLPKVIVMDGLAELVPQRSLRLSIARNMYLQELRTSHQPFDLLIVADLDGVNNELSCGNDLEHAITTAPEGWGALFANQRNAYYDIWALRHPTWCPADCLPEMRREKKHIVNRFRQHTRLQRHVRRRQISIPPTEAPIEVESAFGGFGIYRTAFLEGAWYYGLTRSYKQICEHVPFNERVRTNGAKLFIHPGILNDAQPEHLGAGSGAKLRPWCPGDDKTTRAFANGRKWLQSSNLQTASRLVIRVASATSHR